MSFSKRKILAIIMLLFSLTALISCVGKEEFTIRFMVDEKVYAVVYTKGNEVIKMVDEPIKEGFIFEGWYFDKNVWSNRFDENTFIDKKPTSETTVYAKWILDKGSYTESVVTFKLGYNDSIYDVVTTKQELLAEPTLPTRENYIFLGWWTSNDNGITLLEKCDFTQAIKLDMILYAKWEPYEESPLESLVTFKVGHEIYEESLTKNGLINKPKRPINDNYVFIGWWTSNDNGTTFIHEWDFNQAIESDITLYAKWEKSTGIKTATQLLNIDLDGKYHLVNDIDFNGVKLAPIGTDSTPFTGVFDGNEFKITNYTIDKPEEVYAGLFGYNNGVIQNLGVEDFVIDFVTDKPSNYYVGGLVANNEGMIKDSYAKGIINAMPSSKKEYYLLGGLVGNNNGSILNSYAEVNINKNRTSSDFFSFAGGLVGNNVGTITKSYATGEVSARNAGGLVGDNAGAIIDSYATGDVRDASTNAGGLVGFNGGTISKSWAIGNVYAKEFAGGLVGINHGSNASTIYDGIISESYSTGDVQGTNIVGGLIGSNVGGIITNVYAIGNVTAISNKSSVYAGGLIGQDSYGELLNSYATGKVNATTTLTGNSSTRPIAGGLIGRIIRSTIENSYATGDVSAISHSKSSAYAGALVGYNQEGTITNCFIYSEQEIIRMQESDTYKTASNAYGVSTTLKNIQSKEFLTKELGWSEDHWIFAENAFPRLKL